MSETPNGFKETTTKDLSKFFKLERTIHDLSAKPVIAIGIAAMFLSIVWLATHTLTAGVENQAFIVAAGQHRAGGLENGGDAQRPDHGQ